MRAAFGEQPFSFKGECHSTKSAKLAVLPMQKPHPEMWMQSRDPQTLEFCAEHGINTGYFIVFPRLEAAPRYRKFLAAKAPRAFATNGRHWGFAIGDDAQSRALALCDRHTEGEERCRLYAVNRTVVWSTP